MSLAAPSSSSSSDELLNPRVVRDLGAASRVCLADGGAQKEQRENAQLRQHAADVRQQHGTVKSEPLCNDYPDSERTIGSASTASNRHETCTPFSLSGPAIDEPIFSRIVQPAESVNNAQLSAPTVDLPSGSNDSGHSEQRNPQDIRIGPANGRRRNRVTDRPVEPAEVICDICGQCFVKAAHYAGHITIHTKEKPHECTVCGRRFRQLQSVKMHMMSHTGERPFICEHCGQGHRTAVHLARHKLVHTGERPHACKLCPNRYYDAWALYNHERSHTGERPFACDRCGKRFTRQDNLKRHELIHLAPEKRYFCTLCGKRVSTAYALRQHTARLHSA